MCTGRYGEGMALVHRAELHPSKTEMVADWAPTQPWFAGSGELVKVGEFRFDDPAGQVGIETIFFRAGDGPVLQVPLTYRSEPLAGAESYLLHIMDHSVLGRRWAYDATGDPAYAAAVTTAILTGGRHADIVDVDGELVPRAANSRARGTGSSLGEIPEIGAVTTHHDGPTTVISTGALTLTVFRVVPGPDADQPALIATWPGQDEPATLVTAG